MATVGGRQPFRVGRVLGRSLLIWGRNIVAFTVLETIVCAPLVAYAILAFPRERAASPFFALYTLVVSFGWCMCWFIAPLAVIQGVLRQLRGERASFSECLRVCLTRVFPALGRMAFGPGRQPAAAWIMLFAMIVFGAYGAVTNAVAYHDLRVAKEGVGVEDLVKVFA